MKYAPVMWNIARAFGQPLATAGEDVRYLLTDSYRWMVDPHRTDIETVEVATPRAVPPPAPGGDAASEALPPGWSTAKDDNGRVYYLNNATGASQWTPPTA